MLTEVHISCRQEGFRNIFQPYHRFLTFFLFVSKLFPSSFTTLFSKSELTTISKPQYPFLCRQKRLQITGRSTVSKTCLSPSTQLCWLHPWPRVIVFNWSVNVGHRSRSCQVNTQGYGQQWSNNKATCVVLSVLLCFRKSVYYLPWWRAGTSTGNLSELGIQPSFQKPFGDFHFISQRRAQGSQMCSAE